MARFITLLSMLGSVASILGIIISFKGIESPITAQWTRIAFFVSLGLAGYVLFVPGNAQVRNVESKYKTYKMTAPAEDLVFIQDGSFKMTGPQSHTVRFQTPFIDPPQIEIIAKDGSYGDSVPRVSNITQFQFTASRTTGMVYEGTKKFHPDGFDWIAHGQIMTVSEA